MKQELGEAILSFLPTHNSNFSYGKMQDYKQIIAAGAFSESGDDHYLFIFKDPYDNPTTYLGIMFVYQQYVFEEPLKIYFSREPRTAQRSELFTCTAAFFFQNYKQNTLEIRGEVKQVYEDLHKRLSSVTLEEIKGKKILAQYKFDASTWEMSAQRLELIAGKGNRSNTKREQYKILKRDAGQQPGDNKENLSLGRLALVLEIPLDSTLLPRFIPMIISIRKNGKFGTLKAAVPSQLEQFQLDRESPLLIRFLEYRQRISNKNKRDLQGLETLNKIMFDQLTNLMLEMEDEFTFCQIEENKEEKIYHPLKKCLFNKLTVKFAPNPEGDTLEIYLVVHSTSGEAFEAGTDYALFALDHNLFYLFFQIEKGRFYFASPQNPGDFSRFFRFLKKGRTFPTEELEILNENLMQIRRESLVIEPIPLPLFHLHYPPNPIIKILEGNARKPDDRHIILEFDYESGKKKFLKSKPGGTLVTYRHHEEFEKMCYLLLRNDSFLRICQKKREGGEVTRNPIFQFSNGSELEWLVRRGAYYLDKGFKIYSEKRKNFIQHTGSRLELGINSGTNWIEFKANLQNPATGEIIEISEVDIKADAVKDVKGALHLVKKEELEKLAALFKYAEREGDLFRVPSGNYFLINKLYDIRTGKTPKLNEQLAAFEKLQSYEEIPTYELSTNFQGQLRKYQLAGFSWLRFLQEYNLAGCLADDMGLGKTVQTLALLQTLKDLGKLSASLLVVPVSAIPVWEGEIKKFTPTLRYTCHIGLNREIDRNAWTGCDLIITSYATLRNDISGLKDFQFDYIILDESQNIKNLAAQTTKAVKVVKAHHRLALSGTPIENNSLELWSLFDFLIPGFLGSQQWFKQEWAVPVEKYQDRDKAKVLREMVYPFLLRRKKEDVEAELPEKTEIVETLSMAPQQEELYARIAKHYSNAISKEFNNKGSSRSSVKILEGMLRLRQVCLFPQLLDEANDHIPSVKFDHLKGMLEDILAEGHKVLVFSQFVKVLSILKTYFQSQDIKYSYLDGSVPLKSRQLAIETFQEDKEKGIFLLSLKAGGVALNLTAADYVIIFDPWWNPAVEAQAIDRSHRIGQTRKVIVYRMVVKDSIEEKMLLLQEQKKKLVEQLISTESGGFKNLGREDIMKLFTFPGSNR